MQQDDARHVNKPADCTNVVDEIEIELIEHRSVDGVRGANQQQRVAVGRRIHHGLGPDITPAARPVVDHEGLAEPFRQPLGNQPCDDIVSAARGKADDLASPRNKHGALPAMPGVSLLGRARTQRGALEAEESKISNETDRNLYGRIPAPRKAHVGPMAPVSSGRHFYSSASSSFAQAFQASQLF